MIQGNRTPCDNHPTCYSTPVLSHLCVTGSHVNISGILSMKLDLLPGSQSQTKTGRETFEKLLPSFVVNHQAVLDITYETSDIWR